MQSPSRHGADDGTLSELQLPDEHCATCKGSGWETIICIAGDGDYGHFFAVRCDCTRVP